MKVNSWEWEIDHITFDLINLRFFVNYRFTTILQYLSLYVMAILKILFLASDIYTAIKLIVYNQWTSDVQPFISYTICRWLFFACIALSVIFYCYLVIRSIQAYRTNNVSLTYINSGAKFMKSVRSYKYFCVYNEINSHDFFNYLAFYTYFTIQGCLILLLCDSPRQVINAITIFKILKFNGSMISIIKEIATTNETEAIILSLMTFSFIIWFIFFVKLLFALLLYWPVYHKIKYEYGYKHGLKQYCCVKINQSIQKFIKVKHSKSLEQVKKENSDIHPRIPNIAGSIFGDEEKSLPPIDRSAIYTNNTSQTTLSLQNKAPSQFKESTFTTSTNPFSDLNQQSGSQISLVPAAVLQQQQQQEDQESVLTFNNHRAIGRQNSDITLYAADGSRPSLANPFMMNGSSSNLSQRSLLTSQRQRVPPPVLTKGISQRSISETSASSSFMGQQQQQQERKPSQLGEPFRSIPSKRELYNEIYNDGHNRSGAEDDDEDDDDASLDIPYLNDSGSRDDINVDDLEKERAKRKIAAELELPPRISSRNNDDI